MMFFREPIIHNNPIIHIIVVTSGFLNSRPVLRLEPSCVRVIRIYTSQIAKVGAIL